MSTPGRWRARPGLRAHRAPLVADEVTLVEGIPVTGPARTQFDLAAVLPRDRLERAMNQAEVLGLTDRLSIPHLLMRYPRRRGNAVLRSILGDGDRARGVTANDFEQTFAAFVARHRLPRPRFNADVAIGGRFVRVDALWEEARLIGELDGRQTHGTPLAFESDRERDRQLLIEGWRVTRITWWKLTTEPEALAVDLHRLLDSTSAPERRRPNRDGAASTL